MSREPFEAMPDVMDAKQLAEALQLSKAGFEVFPLGLKSSPGLLNCPVGGELLVHPSLNGLLKVINRSLKLFGQAFSNSSEALAIAAV